MKSLSFTRAAYLPALHAEILAAVPMLRPVAGPDGLNRAAMRLAADATTIYLDVPDEADDAAIGAVVAAHNAATAQAASDAAAASDASDATQALGLRPAGAILAKLRAGDALTTAETQQVVRWLALAVWRLTR